MYGCECRVHKEGWALKNWCFWTVVLEKTLESPLDCKEIKPVNPKGNQSWIFIGRTDAEAEVLILWPPDRKSQLIRKDSEAGKDWRQEEKGMAEDEMVVWHYRLNGHEFEQALGDGEGQGSLVCCSPWGHKESDMTEWQKNNWHLQTLLYSKLWWWGQHPIESDETWYGRPQAARCSTEIKWRLWFCQGWLARPRRDFLKKLKRSSVFRMT